MKWNDKLNWWIASAIGLLLSIGAYALLVPLEIVLGLVGMLFIHEMGHVLAAKRKGLPVSPPLFIPFMGALIVLKRHPRDAVTEAYIAFGGPILGTIGAIAAFLLAVQLENPLLLIVANLGFFLNLMNLLPIHPLDGGRISVAVSRWLWLVGLVGGLFVVIVLKSVLFFIVWALFAWELFYTFVCKKAAKVQSFSANTTLMVPFDRLSTAVIPYEEHQRELSFLTFSSRDGEHKVKVYWERLRIEETIRLPEQGLIKRVYVDRIVKAPKSVPEQLLIRISIDYEAFKSDYYYETPVSIRWKYGFAYLGLAIFLIFMMITTASLRGI